MKIGDTLSLLKNGYKAEEIKEISALSDGNVEIMELAKSAQNMDEFKTLLEISREEPAKDKAPEPPAEHAESEQPPQEPDKEKAELLKENEELKKMLEQAQKANVSRDASGDAGDTTEEQLMDLMRSIY